MKIEFHIVKNLANIAKHKIPLSAALGFDLAGSVVIEDTRFDYPERRYNAFGQMVIVSTSWRSPGAAPRSR